MKTPVSRLAPSNCTSIAAALLLPMMASCASQKDAVLPAVRPTPLQVTINFTGTPPCPTGAVADPAVQCQDPANGSKKIPFCLHALQGESVFFTSSPDPKTPGPEFTLFFDPFKKGALPSKQGTLKVRIDPDAPKKTYNYNVVAEGCPILDPIIIVQ